MGKRKGLLQKTMSRRQLLKWAATTSVGAVLAACQPAAFQVVEILKEVPVEKVVTATPERVAIEFVYHFWPGWKEAVAKIIDMFEAKHPYISVTFNAIGWWDLKTAMTPRFAAGDPPCLINAEGTWPWTEQGQLLDLRPLIDRDGLDLSKQGGDPVAGQVVGDPTHGQYGLPMFVTGCVIAFNKAMFDEHGVPYPKPGWTYDDFREYAITLTRDKNGKSPRDALDFDAENIAVRGFHFWGLQMWDQFIRGFGGTLWSDDRLTCTLDDPKTIECFEWFNELACKYHALLGPPAEPVSGAANPFASGQVAMEINGDWMMPLWQQIEDFDWDIAAMPEGPAGLWQYKSSNQIGIPKGCKHVEAAWEFAKFITFDKEAQFIVGSSLGPALREVAFSEDFLKLKVGKRGASLENARWAFETMHNHGTADFYNQTRNTPEWHPVFYDMQLSVLTLCDKEVEPLLKETAQQITEILQKD